VIGSIGGSEYTRCRTMGRRFEHTSGWQTRRLWTRWRLRDREHRSHTCGNDLCSDYVNLFPSQKKKRRQKIWLCPSVIHLDLHHHHACMPLSPPLASHLAYLSFSSLISCRTSTVSCSVLQQMIQFNSKQCDFSSLTIFIASLKLCASSRPPPNSTRSFTKTLHAFLLLRTSSQTRKRSPLVTYHTY
jgi:hypothetical protein